MFTAFVGLVLSPLGAVRAPKRPRLRDGVSLHERTAVVVGRLLLRRRSAAPLHERLLPALVSSRSGSRRDRELRPLPDRLRGPLVRAWGADIRDRSTARAPRRASPVSRGRARAGARVGRCPELGRAAESVRNDFLAPLVCLSSCPCRHSRVRQVGSPLVRPLAGGSSSLPLELRKRARPRPARSGDRAAGQASVAHPSPGHLRVALLRPRALLRRLEHRPVREWRRIDVSGIRGSLGRRRRANPQRPRVQCRGKPPVPGAWDDQPQPPGSGRSQSASLARAS